MDKISVDLKNCYGIKDLRQEFDFSKTRAYAIYAPNGAMKSSLAQTFKDVAEGRESKDRIFPKRKTVREIKDEAGGDIPGNRVLVLLPYDPELGPSEKTCTLLIDPKLRAEYEQLHVAIEEAKETLLRLLTVQSKSKENLETEISLTVMKTPFDFRGALRRLQPEIVEMQDAPLSTVEYDRVFSRSLIKALNTKGLKDVIREYINRYDELLDQSIYFSRGTFDFYNSAQIASTLSKNGFFRANHTISLKSNGVAREIKNQKELEEVIKAEKESIVDDQKLTTAFEEVEKQLDKNAALRDFRQYLTENKFLLPLLDNLDKLNSPLTKSDLDAGSLV